MYFIACYFVYNTVLFYLNFILFYFNLVLIVFLINISQVQKISIFCYWFIVSRILHSSFAFLYLISYFDFQPFLELSRIFVLYHSLDNLLFPPEHNSHLHPMNSIIYLIFLIFHRYHFNSHAKSMVSKSLYFYFCLLI